MVLPVVLKRRHSLKDVNLLPVIKRIRSGKPESLKEFARINKDTRTENLSLAEIDNHVLSITGEQIGELLMLAGRDENAEEGRWAMHCLILYANEFGQPKGQDLVDNEVISCYFIYFDLYILHFDFKNILEIGTYKYI